MPVAPRLPAPLLPPPPPQSFRAKLCFVYPPLVFVDEALRSDAFGRWRRHRHWQHPDNIRTVSGERELSEPLPPVPIGPFVNHGRSLAIAPFLRVLPLPPPRFLLLN